MFGSKKDTSKESSNSVSTSDLQTRSSGFMQSKSANANLSKPVNTGTIDTLISDACSITGDIHSENSVKIDGKVEGNISVKETVIISKTGVVNGHIEARNLIVYGVFTGNSVTQSIHIQDNGDIRGNINTASLHVEPSATYIGEVSMSSKVDTQQQSNHSTANVNKTVESDEKISKPT